MPMRNRSAIHLSVSVVSTLSRCANRTLKTSPLRRTRRSSSVHPLRLSSPPMIFSALASALSCNSSP